VITEESGDDFSDHIPTPPATPTLPVEVETKEIKEVSVNDSTNSETDDKITAESNDVVVEKSNSVAAPTISVSRPTTPLLRSVSPHVTPSKIPPLSLSKPAATQVKIPVPPLSKQIGLNMMESLPLKQSTPTTHDTVDKPQQFKVITDGKTKVEVDEDEQKPKDVTVEVRKPSTPTITSPTITSPTTPLLRVPSPHTPVREVTKESKEERRRRKKEKRIRELRERGIVVRKPLRKDMKKKLKLRNLKRLPSEFDTEPRKPKPFVDRPSTPPTPQRTSVSPNRVTTTLNTRPVFFNDADTRMSDGSDVE
jgi:hypothetical protein